MSEFNWLCWRLAEHFGIDAPPLVRAEALRSAVREALTLMSIDEVLARLIDDGPLTGARSPYAVLIGRARQLSEDVRLRTRMAEEAAESRRWAEINRAARRGETLRELVDQGVMFLDEVEELLATEFANEDIRAFALDALRGGPS